MTAIDVDVIVMGFSIVAAAADDVVAELMMMLMDYCVVAKAEAVVYNVNVVVDTIDSNNQHMLMAAHNEKKKT